MRKLFIAAAATFALAGAQAIAQTTESPSTARDPGTTTAAPKTQEMAPASPSTGGVNYYSKNDGAWRASKLIGTKVMNMEGETVGDINEIVLDGAGKATAAVIGVGGFLGLGEHEVAVNFDSLKVSRDNSGKAIVTLNVTKDSLKTAPQWKWST